jgi:uncharacterized membrane protein HdeD (DUF308 family)
MKDFFKRVKADAIMSAVLCIALGVVLIVWPGETIDIVCKVLAAGLIILGGVELFSYITNRNGYMFTGILGLIVLIIGVWIFLKPSSIVSLVPIVIGVILAVHGVQDVKMALESKNGGYDRWWIMLIIAIISIAFGVLCIVNAFGMVKLAMQFVGVALIYDGISDLWVVTKTVRTVKDMEQEAKAVDVDYKEID